MRPGHAKGRSPKARTPARVGAVIGGSMLAHLWSIFASAPGEERHHTTSQGLSAPP
jgi:hypothetical protein